MIDSESREKFDTFYRKILYGENKHYPKPKLYKLQKNQLFPDRYNVFECVYDKRNNGTWITWLETADKLQQIPANAKVSDNEGTDKMSWY